MSARNEEPKRDGLEWFEKVWPWLVCAYLIALILVLAKVLPTLPVGWFG